MKKLDTATTENTPQTPECRNYVYLLRCGDDSLYCGWTNDLEHRVATHQAGKGGKYTRSHLPVELAYFEVLPTKEDALRREAAIKRLPRAKKEALVSDFSFEQI